MNSPAQKAPAQRVRKVLVVDDEQTICDILEQLLETEACEVVVASSGIDALTILNREDFDLIISDIVMPGMDGLEVLRKAKHIRPEIPVIMMSGFPSVDTTERLKNSGAASYLAKPFTPDILKRVVAGFAAGP